MPERKSMSRIKECLRLYYEAHQSQATVARALGVARSTVWDYLQRVEREELSWAQLRDLPADELEARLFSTPKQGEDTRPLPVWEDVHKQLHSRTNVTQQSLVWFLTRLRRSPAERERPDAGMRKTQKNVQCELTLIEKTRKKRMH